MPVVPNNTHYWNSHTKLYNEFPSIASFSYQSSRRMSYFQRLHYECEYTKLVNGKVFFILSLIMINLFLSFSTVMIKRLRSLYILIVFLMKILDMLQMVVYPNI